jgi:predicted amidohydrolase YtcJ
MQTQRSAVLIVDMIVTNAKVLTMDPALPRAEAVAVDQGKIIAVGTRAEIEALATPGTRIIDAKGRMLLPGFVESHLHLALGGAELMQLQLGGLAGFDAIAAAFRAYAAKHPDLAVIFAQGAGYGGLGSGATRQMMDQIISDRPIAMMAPDHHTVWTNTAALAAAGILNGAPMPHGHEIVMAPDGTATGELLEFEAFGPIIQLAGLKRLNLGIATGEEPETAPSAADREADKTHIVRGLAHCAQRGITSMVNMDGNRYLAELLSELQAEGRLTARVVVPFHMKPHMDMAALDRASAMKRDFTGEWVRSGFVKMFMDGVVDSRTAFMLTDYPGVPGHKSEPLFAPDRFKDICAEIDRRGLQIAVHAIGDAAVRTTIDGYEAAKQRNGARDSRHRIEHIELIDRADVPRLGALGITASIQPSHPPGTMDFPMESMEVVYHRHRWKDAYLWRTLRDHGAPIAYASDWPVTDVSVLRGLKAALCRVPYEGADDERLNLMDSLYAYTAGGAWAAHMEDLTGTLRPGLAADLVLIDGDLESTPPQAFDQLSVALTVVGGRITHQTPGIA